MVDAIEALRNILTANWTKPPEPSIEDIADLDKGDAKRVRLLDNDVIRIFETAHNEAQPELLYDYVNEHVNITIDIRSAQSRERLSELRNEVRRIIHGFRKGDGVNFDRAIFKTRTDLSDRSKKLFRYTMQYEIVSFSLLASADDVIINPSSGGGDASGSFQSYDGDLTAIANLTPADGKFIIGNGTTWITTSTVDISANTNLVAGTGITLTNDTLNIGGLTVSELAANSLQLSSESFADNDTSLMTSAAIQDKIQAELSTFTSGVDLTAGTGMIIQNETNTASGDYTATITLDLLDEDNMASDSATKAASQQSIKAYVTAQVAALVDSAPDALDTLNELAAAINDDASFTSTITTSIGTKLAKASNLSDLASVSTARSNLGLGSIALLSSIDISSNTNLAVGAGLTLSGDTISSDLTYSSLSNNRILTAASSTSFQGESSFTYDGTILTQRVASANPKYIIHADTDSSPSPIIEMMRGAHDTWGSGDNFQDWRITNENDLVFDSGTSSVSSGAAQERLKIGSTGTLTINNAYTLPSTDGTANYVLKTNGSGVLSWAADGNTEYNVGDGGLTQNNFTDALKSKLDAIEASATADQTASEIRTLVESASDSNVFTDADHSKLNAIEASATADQTASEITALLNDIASYSLGTADSGIITVNHDLTVAGDLIISGATTTVNSNTVNIGDSIITLNSDETGTPSQDAGIEIERGTSTNKSLYWDESEDEWTIGAERFKAGSFEGDGSLLTALNGSQVTSGTIAAARVATLNQDTTGNAATATTATNANQVNATNDRDLAPEDLNYANDFQVFFTSKEGLEDGSTNGSNYMDAIVLNTWSDASGHDANVLAFDKSTKAIYHYQADQAATNWGTAKQLAYTDQITSDVTISANNDTDETVYLTFVDGATGSQGLETDTGLSYNPNSGRLTANVFVGDATGTATALATARAINGVNFDGTADITITAAGSTLSDTVTVAKGGTGATTLTSNAILTGNGTSAIQAESTFTYDGAGIAVISGNLPQLQLVDSDSTNDPMARIMNNNGNLSIRADSSNVGTGGAINFQTSGSEKMRIQDSGNVGIGTTSPASQLDISSASTATLRLSNSDGGLTEGQITGEIIFYQDDDSGSGDGITGRIGMRSAPRSDGTYYGTAGDMAFFVAGLGNFSNANQNADLEAMTIRAGGKVGIGTTTPSTLFHVSNAAHPSIRVTGTDNAGADPAIELLGTANSFVEGGQLWYDNGTGVLHLASLYNNDAADIQFHTKTAADRSTSNVRMTIAGDGNVGIGTTNPSTALQVDGTVTATAFAGALTGNVTGNVSGSSGSTTGNAATATTLATARNIAGQSFNGSASITIATGDLSDIAGLKDEDDMASDSAIHIATQQSIKAYVDAQTSATTVAVTDSTANTNFPVVFHNESNGLLDDTGALRYNPSTGTLLVPNLSVAGTTTQVDTVTMNAANAVVFEGATPDAYETTLTITDPTADRTITLPNASGTVLLNAGVQTITSDTTGLVTGLVVTNTGSAGNSSTVSGIEIKNGTGTDSSTHIEQDAFGITRMYTGQGAKNEFLHVSADATIFTIAGDLKLGGNDIKASDGTTAITTSGADVSLAGNVGIGTTSPDSILDISATTPILTVQTTASNSQTSSILVKGARSGDGSAFGQLTFANNDDSGTNTGAYDGARILAFNDGGDKGAGLQFQTVPTGSSTSLATALTITEDSKVGIGTTSPSTKFHLLDSAEVVMSVDSSHSIGSTISLDATATGGDEWRLISAADGAGTTDGTGAFGLYNIDVSAYRLVVEGTTGHVGIGTATPSEMLHVESADEVLGLFKSTDAGAGIKIDTPNDGYAVVFFSEAGTNKWSLGKLASNSDKFSIYDEVNTTPRLVIDTDGDIGIGTTSPSSKLEIAGNTSGNLQVAIDNDHTAGLGTYALQEDGATVGIFQYRGSTNGTLPNTVRVGSNVAGGSLAFTYAGGTTGMYIKGSDGKVGIGTTAPSAPLHIKSSTTGAMLLLEGTDASNATAPDIVLLRSSSSPADNDFVGTLDFKANNSNGDAEFVARIIAQTRDVTDGTEDGALHFKVAKDNDINVDNSELKLISGTGIIFNDAGHADMDFRVESDAYQNMFYLDAGLNKIGINTVPDNSLGLFQINVGNSTQNALTLISTDSDATSAPTLELFRNSGSPADNDMIGQIVFSGEDDAGNKTQYMALEARIQDMTNGTEDGTFEIINGFNGGAERTSIYASSTQVIINLDYEDMDFNVRDVGDKTILHANANTGRITLGRPNSGGITDAINTLNVYHDGSDGFDGMMIVNTDTSTVDNQILGGIGFDSNDGNVPSTVTEASVALVGYASEDHATTDKGGYLSVLLTEINDDDDTVSTEALRVSTVSAGTSSTLTLKNGNASMPADTKYAAIDFHNIDSSGAGVGAAINAMSAASGRGGYLEFQTGTTVGDLATRMTLTDTGQILLTGGTSAAVAAGSVGIVEDGDTVEIRNQHGSINIGATNTSYMHITTDRSRFYFDESLVVNDGMVSSYDEDLQLKRAQSDDEKIVVGDNSMTFTSAGNDVMQIDGTNTRVGIGTGATVDATLHVEGSVLIDAYEAGAGAGLFFRDGFLNTNQPSITVQDHSGANPDGLAISAYDGISFRLNAVEKARFDDAGKLGLGTDSPDAVLHVQGSANDEVVALFTTAGGTGGSVQGKAHIGLSHFNSDTAPSVSLSAIEIDVSDHRADFAINTRGTASSNAAPTEKLRVTHDGSIKSSLGNLNTCVSFVYNRSDMDDGAVNLKAVSNDYSSSQNQWGFIMPKSGRIKYFVLNTRNHTVTGTNEQTWKINNNNDNTTSGEFFQIAVARGATQDNTGVSGDATMELTQSPHSSTIWRGSVVVNHTFDALDEIRIQRTDAASVDMGDTTGVIYVEFD